jgi:hypothetical protein
MTKLTVFKLVGFVLDSFLLIKFMSMFEKHAISKLFVVVLTPSISSRILQHVRLIKKGSDRPIIQYVPA